MLSKLIAAWRRVLLVGPPGIAKTGMIRAAAQECGLDISVMRAGIMERVDASGALVPDQERGVTRALPLEQLHALRTTDRPTLLFLDDIGQGPIDVQAGLMGLFDPGALPEHVLICGATNRVGDKAGVHGLCEPLRSRFDLAFSMPTPPQDGEGEEPKSQLLCSWREFLDLWVDWLMDHDSPPEIIAYHRTTGLSGKDQQAYRWKPQSDPAIRMPDCRTWETVARLWNADLRDLATISGAIGKPAAAHFLAFARLADQLPSLDQIRLDPHNCPVPTDPGALCLLSTTLASAATPGDIGAWMNYASRWPRPLTALMARDIFRRPKVSYALSGNKIWVQWMGENHELTQV